MESYLNRIEGKKRKRDRKDIAVYKVPVIT
jgi:hypothetical protein